MAGATSIAALAACIGVRQVDEGAHPQDQLPPAVAAQQIDNGPEFAISEWTAPDETGPRMTVTRPAWGLPKPLRPDEMQFAGPKEVRGAWVYPPSRRSTGLIGGMAVDGGYVDNGVRFDLTLSFSLIASDPESGELLWKQNVAAYYDSLRLVDVEVEGRKVRAVRLESSGTRAPELWAYYDAGTGAPLDNPDAAPAPTGLLTALTTWSGAKAFNDQALSVLATSATEWAALRKRLFVQAGITAEGAPPMDLDGGLGGIDFAREAVLVVSLGRATNCRGVGLHSAYVAPDRVLVRLNEFTYQSSAGFGDQTVEAPIERPWGVFRIPRLGHPGRLIVEHNTQRFIMGPAIWEPFAEFALP